MKKIGLSVLAIIFAATSLMAKVPAHKKVAKHATCTHCPKGQKCSKPVCANPASCCK
ncbi:hypothetical protein ACFGVR_22575 [Mucilaginibacter sp. AW1-3]